MGEQGCPRCAQDDPLLGRTIGDKYLVRDLLGSGAMGKVYRAEHTPLERLVALKVLHPHLACEESLVHRFLREARAASKLSHPNIVTLLDFGQDPQDGLLYLVMELLEGRSLQDLLDQDGALELPRVHQLASQILLALDEAHARGIVHRDLKPDNIIILETRHGEQVKVVDFGLAQLVDTDAPRLTSTGLICGTPSYISPEQARAADVGPLTDIYSFGVMLYEMTTGLLPFDAASAYEMVTQHLTRIPPRPELRAPGCVVPARLSDLIMRCLQKDPDDRFSGAAEVHDALLAVPRAVRPQEMSPAPAPAPGGERPCPVCCEPMPPRAGFCGVCGAQMDAPVAPADAALERLGKFVPRGVLDAIVHGTDLLQSQRRQVTVLFAEVAGLESGRLDPEQMLQVINRCFDVLVEAVHHHEGTVDTFVGDCVMAVFGAPVCHEDDPARAVAAAFDMRRAIATLGERLPFQVGLRVGINAGTVVAGPVGGASRLDYTVVGETVRLAQRLEGSAAAGQILVSEEVYRGCQRELAFRPLPSVRLDGPEGRIAVFEPVEPEKPAPPAPQRPPVVLVGRTEERSILEEAALRAVNGEGSALVISGEAGIGKTALLAHAGQRMRELGLRAHLVRARPRAGASALDAVLRGLLGCPADATQERVRGRLDAVDGLDETDREALAFIALPSRSRASLPAGAIDLTCATALRRLLRLIAATTPTAVLVDEIRHLEGRERRLLVRLAANIHAEPAILAVAGREPEPALLEHGARHLRLGPLHPSEGERLVRRLAGGRAVNPESLRRALESSGGNPLYLVETTRYLEREGYLVASPRAPQAPRVVIPGNIRALVLSRLDALEPAARNTLLHAALIGPTFAAALLPRLLPGHGDLPEIIEALEASGFLEREGAGLRLRYCQELVREILCDTLTREKRREVHGKLATLLLDGADPEMPTAELARQLELAGRDVEAGEKYELAADEHADRGEPAEAARLLRLALRALERAGNGSGRLERTTDLLVRLARALNRSSQWPEARETALRARNRALPAGDVILAARAALELARAAGEEGDLPLADSVLDEAYQTALECGELNLAAELASSLGEVQERSGRLDRALETLEGAHQRLQAAARRARRSQAIAASAQVAEVLNRLGRVKLRMARSAEAVEHLQAALEHAALADDPLLRGRVLGNLGQAQAVSGDTRSGLETLEQALATLQHAGDRLGTAKLLHNLARLHLARGSRAQATALARESLSLSVEIGWNEGQAMTTALIDQIA